MYMMACKGIACEGIAVINVLLPNPPGSHWRCRPCLQGASQVAVARLAHWRYLALAGLTAPEATSIVATRMCP